MAMQKRRVGEKIIAKLKAQGFITFDELNGILGDNPTAAEIENITAQLSELDIPLVEGEASSGVKPKLSEVKNPPVGD